MRGKEGAADEYRSLNVAVITSRWNFGTAQGHDLKTRHPSHDLFITIFYIKNHEKKGTASRNGNRCF